MTVAATVLAAILVAHGASPVAARDVLIPECGVNDLRPFVTGKAAKECARDTNAGSSFQLLRAPPTDDLMLAICKSAACRTLFDDEAGATASTPGGDCIVPTGERIQLYADLVEQVRRRCSDLKDAYVLVDCDVIGTRGRSSEFWYFPDSANASAAPVDAKRWTATTSEAATWEGDEVAASRDGWELFAYIEDTGRTEPVGEFAGLLEAGRRGATSAFECRRADDHRFPASGGKRCERRYICFSE